MDNRPPQSESKDNRRETKEAKENGLAQSEYKDDVRESNEDEYDQKRETTGGTMDLVGHRGKITEVKIDLHGYNRKMIREREQGG